MTEIVAGAASAAAKVVAKAGIHGNLGRGRGCFHGRLSRGRDCIHGGDSRPWRSREPRSTIDKSAVEAVFIVEVRAEATIKVT